ncbi:Polysaccharide deacetylase [Seinonella peptonophila]|uniref:Polysaccharide deacetylase n=1 Tax=Seinonella peptonophila TaxID=112248 RepID=A0A1M5AD90_9BACL|nr:polysaccharide deacetylase family protein [Seinonella peptonophila]SHF28301.1 Polysaccharide deacetylase [Seinonella peptonophila]
MITVIKPCSSTTQRSNGVFMISLDFELYWGVRDKLTKEAYGKNILGVRSVIPAVLKLFKQYHIHATWAIVGFLFFKNKGELINQLPEQLPNYEDKNLSPYPYIDSLNSSEFEDPFHFSPSLIKIISTHLYQEIGTHTFSHYYCLEKGQTKAEFEKDLEKSVYIAKQHNINLKSIVFPRNQVNSEYLSICKQLGITSYRGNNPGWFYQPMNHSSITKNLKRCFRYIDSYLNLSGHNTYKIDHQDNHLPLNLPASRFLRPYSKRFRFFESIRLNRICSELTHAAKTGEIYHLWWHPHNFGINLDENILFLEKIFIHFSKLKKKYGMESMNMSELSHMILSQ